MLIEGKFIKEASELNEIKITNDIQVIDVKGNILVLAL